MGILRKPAGVAATLDPVALVFPWPVLPTYAGWLGSTLTRSARNLAAPRQTALTLVGTPSVATAGMTATSSSAYLSGTVAETDDQTLVIAFRSDQDQSSSSLRMSPGGWASGDGLCIYSGSATLLRYSAQYNVSGTPTTRIYSLTMPSGYAATWGLYAVVQEAGVGLTIYDLTRGTSQASAETSARILSTSGAFRVGSVSGGNAGDSQIAFAAVIPAALTSGELATLRTAVAARALAVNGITL